ncbi:MAG: hypothetical protein WCL06_06035 [Bacteroidota bacterium]
MKRCFTSLVILALCASLKVSAQSIGISDVTHTPDASAALDVYSTTRGLLIPRLALTSTSSVSPVSSPIASMMVYNTATTGDVTPGYYFWDGTSKWLRLLSNADHNPLNVVTKTANATLLKTENMVMASNDIVLTLPVVSSADNGLEITVKNIGSYMDQVEVAGNGAATIDAGADIDLFRWESNTFIASGGNWVLKDPKPRLDNVFNVDTHGSWTTVAEVIAFLGDHMEEPSVVQICGGTYDVASTININLAYPLTLQGTSFGTTEVAATAALSGSTMFTCATECYFKMIMFKAYANTSGNDGIRFTGSAQYHEVKDCNFFGFNKGIVVSGNNDLWVFETDFEDHTGVGIEVAAGTSSGGSLKASECDFTKCAKGINLLSGVGQEVSILNCTFYNTTSGTDIGLNYVPATFTSYTAMFITNNSWNNQGTFMSGFDFTRSDGRDANVFLVNNAGMQNQNPHCKINVNNNTATTTVTTSGTYYKANWTNTSSYTCKWTLANNKMTYQPSNGRDVYATITGNIAVDHDSHVVTIAIVRNGVTTTRYGETDLRIMAGNQPMQFSTVIYVPDIKKNDYLELYVTSSSNGDVVTFQDVQWFTNTQ